MNVRTPSLLCLAATLALGACAGSQPAARPDPAAPGDLVPFVYVAGYRPEILIFRLDTASGKLTPAGQADAGTEVSFLAFDPARKFLFAVNELPKGRLVAFSIDQATGALTRLNDVSAAGSTTAYLSVDKSGRFLLAANYAGKEPGTIGVFPIGADGRLGEAVDTFDFGPNSMPHMITTDPTNRFVMVPCKGGPFVAQFKLDGSTGKLTPNDPARVPAAPKAGPRHMDFHPNGKFAYVINEQGMTLAVYAYDGASGRLTIIETVSTLPPGTTETQGFSTADVHVHPSGKLLYGSNRGHDSVVIYRIDAESGRLTLVGHEKRTIKRPRNFHIDPTGSLLMVANQDGDSVTMFRINQADGTLELLGEPVPAGHRPSYVGVALLPGK